MKSRPASTQPLPTPWCALCARSPGVGGSSSSPSTSRAAAPSSGSTAWLSCAAVSWSSQRPLTSSRECASRQASPARPASTSPTTCSTCLRRMTRCASSPRGWASTPRGCPSTLRHTRRAWAWPARRTADTPLRAPRGRVAAHGCAWNSARSSGGRPSQWCATLRCCGCISSWPSHPPQRWGVSSTAWATTCPGCRIGSERSSSCSRSSASPGSLQWRCSWARAPSPSVRCATATTACHCTSSPSSASTRCCCASCPPAPSAPSSTRWRTLTRLPSTWCTFS
mmetsp:Transcript_32467/g.80768  ORF Transcript_32467/g.80768 Transcript_32467/m.80768 type:complete len:282 (+) Transcript_32467:3165-4010(+)